ncbi:MAG: U3 small nucleolar RNA-associated protein [Chrysothrix sp. TS-e1954]|nr:MAG: U3 small nucleolar RNA-associated protein [Chrysothrix sp. TS-e1954]
MDIHRCRFVDWSPEAINALAFSHTTGTEARSQPLRLAIGRANGNIELWNPSKGLWLHEKTLYGGRDRSVDGLTWTHDPDERDERGFITIGRARLFSIGYSSTVTEWDLVSGLPLRQSSGSHSEIWCLASQPPTLSGSGRTLLQNASTDDETFNGQNIAVGCADGSLVLLSTADESLNFKNFIGRAPKKGARTLCIAWQNRNIVISGYADSMIRIHNVKTGANVRNMFIGGGPRGGPRETLVWAVTCLADGTIVSGDSNGEVTFWDGNNYTQLQCIKAHEADTLCLASSEDGETLFSGSMDRRTAVYSKQLKGNRTIWHKKAHQRLHTHDVKAMARFDSKKLSFVVSGGVDATPIVTPLRNFGSEHHRTLPYVPQRPMLTGRRRMVVSWSDHEVTLWRVSSRAEQSKFYEQGIETPEYGIVARLGMKSEENIQCAALSSDGSLLAVGSAAETKLFHLQASHTDAGLPKIKIKKVENSTASLAIGSRILLFSFDSKWLLSITQQNTILATYLSVHSPSNTQFIPVNLRRRPPPKDASQNSFNGSWGNYERMITQAAFSYDSRILVVSDLAGNLDTFVLEGQEDPSAPAISSAAPEKHSSDSEDSSDDTSASDSDAPPSKRQQQFKIIYGQHWARISATSQLPHLPSAPLVLSFRPSLESSSLLTYAHQTNGNPAVPPKRLTPHAHSNTLRPTEDRILILTSTHELREFHALTGQLTAWSQRNPSSLLPPEFKLQRERAQGCLWDTQITSSRVWLYGANWLAMFDLAVDFPAPASEAGPAAPVALTNGDAGADTQKSKFAAKRDRKRKRARETQKNTAGAGSRIEEAADLSKRSRKKRRTEVDVKSQSLDIARDDHGDGEEEDSADGYGDEDNHGVALALTRRRARSPGSEQKALTNGVPQDKADQDGGADTTSLERDPTQEHQQSQKSFYITTRYRHILGILPLAPDPTQHQTYGLDTGDESEAPKTNGHADHEEPEARDAEPNGILTKRTSTTQTSKGQPLAAGLEVALVERPPWDLELPPRFYGRHEYGER